MSGRRQREAQSRVAALWRRRAFTFLLFVVVVFLVRAAFEVRMKEREAAQNLDHAQLSLDETSMREAKLKYDIDRLETTEGQEEAMRQQFQMGRPGEGMLVLVDPEAPATTTLVKKTGWQKFWALVRGE
jgi:flagellar biosynthesis/type III secretory pathway M-ring protein FliF/YscJ